MGTLRIVAGELRGRRIPVPDDPAVRPTPDRVREAIFDILGQTLDGLEVLDAFAGTGALGFEALSRGAHRVTFVESDARTLALLRRTAEALGAAARVRTFAGRAERDLARLAGNGFDLVLADPPYASELREAFLAELTSAGALREGSVVVVEREARSGAAHGPPGLILDRSVRYGRTAIDLYHYESSPSSSSGTPTRSDG